MCCVLCVVVFGQPQAPSVLRGSPQLETTSSDSGDPSRGGFGGTFGGTSGGAGGGGGGGGGEEKGEDDDIASPSSSFDDLLANRSMLHKAVELLLLHTRTQPQQDQGDAAVATVGDAKALDSLLQQLLRFMQDMKQTKGKTVGRVSGADEYWGMC
jgi:hypothetical protein